MNFKNQIPDGVYPVMLTPYTDDNTIDTPALNRLVHWYASKGCTGLFALCTSSEIPFLSLKEKLLYLDETIKAAKETGKEMCIVASGHTSCSLEAQAEELTALYEGGADVMCLVTNRLDQRHEGDKVWLENAEKLLSLLPEDISLGLYECPSPYKRLISPEILKWAKDTGKFRFIKDTCCDPVMLKERLDIVRGSELKLLNANAQTYLYSLRLGARGYSSVMSNFHPELYAWITDNFEKYPELAQHIQDILCMTSFTEALHYPTTAKYYLNRLGVTMNVRSRSVNTIDVTPYEVEILNQLEHITQYVNNLIKHAK